MSEIRDKKTINDRLCRMVEDALHQKMSTSRDFEKLAEALFSHTHVMVSVTTLKRFWGQVNYDHEHSMKTLDTLAQFVGFPNYDTFCEQLPETNTPPSNTVVSNHIDVTTNLAKDDIITLYWAPNRRCKVRYLGDTFFQVVDSDNTHLLPGNTFSCALIIESEPLYLCRLVQEDRPPVNYVCGKKGGIRFVYEKHAQ